jgi:predicted RNA-binding Zn-ribbon protein involved in translation (DUF1610 family)
MTCYACGREMREAAVSIRCGTEVRAYGPKCGRAVVVRKLRARRRDAGVPRLRVDPRQVDWIAAA